MRVLVLGAGFGGLELTTTLVRGARRRRRGHADRQGRGLRLRLLQAGRDVRRAGPRRRCVHRTATSSSRVCASCRPTSARSTPRPAASRPTPARSTATSWWSRSAPTSTRRRRPGWSRRATSSTRWPGRSPPATCWRLRRRARRRRCHVDAVQVPTGAERDRAADARVPHRAWAAGRSEIALVMPLPVPIPPSPDASKAILEAFAERGIEWHPSHLVRELDPARKVARFDDGTEMPFDLFLGVPRAPRAGRGRRVGDVRRRLDPGRSGDAGHPVAGRLRRRRRDERRHAQGRRVRRGTGRRRRRRDHRHGARRHRRRVRRTGRVLPRVRRPRCRRRRRHLRSPARRRSVSSTARRSSSPRRRPSSAPPGSSAGSARTGDSAGVLGVPGAVAGFMSSRCRPVVGPRQLGDEVLERAL